MSQPVVILGCGPAGLAAAAAVVSSGREAVIVSNTTEPSTLYGCQYLHSPIPEFIGVARARVSYALIGTPEQYRTKVYGDKWQGKVSPEDFIGEHDAWDIRETYAWMWDDLIVSGRVGLHETETIHDGILPEFVYAVRPSLIISTIPATAICYREDHRFAYHAIYANGSRHEMPYTNNSIICDGTSEHEWYRVSRVFGFATTEWPSAPASGEPNVCVPKPLSTDCNCYPEIRRVGRYGKWQKSVLVHEVYPEVMEMLK